MAFLFVPLMTTSMSGIAKEKMGNATSIYNLMRNIGGSFGIAMMTTFLARRGQVHQGQLISHVTPMDIRTQTTFRGLQSWFALHQPLSAYDAAHKSWGAIYLMVQQQAAMLSFVEAFWIMAVIFWGWLRCCYCCAMRVICIRIRRRVPFALRPRRRRSRQSSSSQNLSRNWWALQPSTD